MLQHHGSLSLVRQMQTDTNRLKQVHTQTNCVLMQGRSQITQISTLAQSPNHTFTTHTQTKCYLNGPRQKAVMGRQALWSRHWWVFIAKVKDRCCVRRLASGERLMFSLICRMIAEKHARRCRFGAYYFPADTGVRPCVCAHKSLFVWVVAPVLEQSHSLIRTYEREVSSIYWNIRCCGLANIWISDGIVAAPGVLPDSAQLDFARSCEGVVHNHNEWKGLRCCLMVAKLQYLHYSKRLWLKGVVAPLCFLFLKAFSLQLFPLPLCPSYV